MKLLRMYYLEDYGLTPEQCVRIKESLNLDHIIQVKANNQLEHTQYPVFEFEEIDFQTENKGVSAEVNREKLNDIIIKQSRQTPERNTSL